jgi:hypothetical protein
VWKQRFHISANHEIEYPQLAIFFQLTKIDTHKNNWIHSNRIYYNKWCVITYVLCMRISNISLYVSTEMCTNNKFVSTLIYRNPFVVKVNQFTTKFKSVFDSHYQMHIRLTHNRSRRIKTLLNFVVNWFTFTTNGFLFFFILKLENVGLSVDFHWTLWKSSRPLLYLMSAGFGCSGSMRLV